MSSAEEYRGHERRSETYKCSEERRLTDIEHMLKGNGQEGIQARVIRIEEKLDSLIKGKTNWPVVVSLLLTASVLVVMIITLINEAPVT